MRSDWVIRSFLVVGLGFTFVFIVLPAMHAIQLSFYDQESFISEAHFVGLANYVEVLSDPAFWRALLNGSIFAIASIVLQIVLGIGFALILNRKFLGRGLARGVSILPYLLPTVVVALCFQWMLDGSNGVLIAAMKAIGIKNVSLFETPTMAMTMVVVISAWIWTPFVTTTFLAALQTVPRELYEAARVDGANAWRRFWEITVPVLKPVLTVIVLLRAIWMFNKFDIIWLLTQGGPVGATEHLPILAYRKTFTLFDIGGGAAVATISFLILSVAVFIYFRLFPLDED